MWVEKEQIEDPTEVPRQFMDMAAGDDALSECLRNMCIMWVERDCVDKAIKLKRSYFRHIESATTRAGVFQHLPWRGRDGMVTKEGMLNWMSAGFPR